MLLAPQLIWRYFTVHKLMIDDLMEPLKSARALIFYAFLCGLTAIAWTGCRKNDKPVEQARHALQKGSSPKKLGRAGTDQEEPGNELVLPAQVRLERRLQRTTETLSRFGPPPRP